MNQRIIAPSVLSADFGNLSRDVQMLNESSAEWIHIDIMDGHFVPNISFGFPVLKSIQKASKKFMDVHLMIENPDFYIDRFIENGADLISVHYEACTHLHRTIQYIKSKGIQVGVAINPHTSVSLVKDILADIDLLLIMSVNPGYGGQKFIDNTFSKVSEARDLAKKYHPNLKIEIDGGVNLDNAPKLFELGANVLVAGNTVFSSENPKNKIEKLLEV